MKKKILVPLSVFLLGICLAGLLVWKTDTHEKEQRRTTAQLNATTYGERIKNEITNGIEITDALKQILISEDGEINHFDTIAENLMSDSVESVQIAPDGIVTDIYPAEGNEAGKIDLFHDKDRSKISCYARDLRLLSCAFLIFFQTQLKHFRILDMNIDFLKKTLPGVMIIKLFISQMVK